MPTDPNFRMIVADVFAIPGLGTVAAGQIELGTINLYDDLWVHGNGDAMKTGVSSIQLGTSSVKTAAAGALVGLVLRGLREDQVRVGNLLSAQK
jgi:translation elongation factor EF-Tu-like GTPase